MFCFFRKEILVVFSLLPAANIIFADLAVSPRGDRVGGVGGVGGVGSDGNHVVVPSRRRLKAKKSKKTESPTFEPTSSSFQSFTFRTVQTNFVVIDAFTTIPPDIEPSQSFVGGTQIFTAGIFDEDDIDVDGNGNLIGPVPTSTDTYTNTCQLDSGVFPFIRTISCVARYCFPRPLFGGCIFMRSGGEFDFDVISGEKPPTITQVSAGGNTGVGLFGFEIFASVNQLSTDPELSVDEIVITILTPDNSEDIINRNIELGREVPGFIPEEGKVGVMGDGTTRNGNSSMSATFPHYVNP